MLATEIFTALGMGGTFAGSPGDRADIAAGQDRNGDPVPSWELDVVNVGAGDVWSTAADLVTWLDALRAGRLLGARYRTLMIGERARTGGGPDADGYGYGFFTGTVAGHPWFHHSGENAGFRAFDACVPELGCRIALLSNSDATGPAVGAALLEFVLG